MNLNGPWPLTSTGATIRPTIERGSRRELRTGGAAGAGLERLQWNMRVRWGSVTGRMPIPQRQGECHYALHDPERGASWDNASCGLDPG